jgi:hypothetical protein
MSKTLKIFLCLTLITSLGACNLPSRGSSMGVLNATDIYQTVAVNLTQMANLTSTTPFQIKTPTPTNTQLIIQTSATARPSTAVTIIPNPTEIPMPCNQAAAGHPFDVTVSDGTRMKPGEVFSKTWRLENFGSCPWTTNYAVVWFSGENMGVTDVKPFTGPVKPGQIVDITIDMVSPDQPGTYQSNWKLRNSEGALFGIGPNGDAPFWARIEVVAENTPTATENPTALATPEVLVSGTLLMEPDDSLDLDSGTVNSDQKNDIKYQMTPDLLAVVTPLNGARLVLVGAQAPEQPDCMSKTPGDKPVQLTGLLDGVYICYWTDQGVPGYAHLLAADSATKDLTVEYTTWRIP